MPSNTSNNIPGLSKATEKQSAEFNLTKHLVDFLWSEPFYSRILRSLNKIETDKVPTAGVSASNGDLVFLWNRSWLASLEPKKVKGLLKHECLHLVFGHTTERSLNPHLMWNYATDLAINSTIPEYELPEGGLIPGKALPKLSPQQKADMSNEAAERYQKISDLIEKLPRNKTSEYYFHVLAEDETMQEMVENASAAEMQCIGFDDHDGWNEIPEEEREQIAAKVKDILKDAVNECQNRNWGSVPTDLIKEIQKLVEREIKWQDLLRRFCGFSRKNERTSSIKRLNRKYPNIHPGAKKKYTPMIAVYIDESGSVSDTELAKFYAELNSLSNQTDFYLYRFDTEVNEKDAFLWKKKKRMDLSRLKMGGTCFDCVTEHAIKNKNKFDGYIILTDGCAPKPALSRGIKRCWILVTGATMPFIADKSDIVITMK